MSVAYVTGAPAGRHHRVLAAAHRALGDLPVTASPGSRHLVEVGAAWAEYFATYEALRVDPVNAEAEAWLRLEDLRRRLEQVCLDAGVAGAAGAGDPAGPIPPERAGPVAARPAPPPVGASRPAIAHRHIRPEATAIPWLAWSNPANAEPLTLYVWSALRAADVYARGLPTPDLFLVGSPDLATAVRGRPRGSVLAIEAPAGTAIDVATLREKGPDYLPAALREGAAIWLLPLGTLPEVSILAVRDLDDRGRIGDAHESDADIAIRFTGADHGVVGLPNDVARWPIGRVGTHSTAATVYLPLPSDRRQFAEWLTAYPGAVPAFREKGDPRPGADRLVVRIGPQAAIDVAATTERLCGVALAGPDLSRFDGLDLLLPHRVFATAHVLAVVAPGRRAGPHPLVGRSLHAVVEAMTAGGGPAGSRPRERPGDPTGPP